MPSPKKKLKWVVEFSVDPSWVADGFELTDECAVNMLQGTLSWAYEHELGARVIKSPSQKEIKRLQGYEVAK